MSTSPTSTRERALAWQAAAWFHRRDRIVLDLQVRQRLELRELADATGVSDRARACVEHEARGQGEPPRRGAARRPAPARVPRAPGVPEHAFDPRVTMRRFAPTSIVARAARKARLELPAATDLVASIPGEAEPAELRGEALERVHLVLRELEASAGGVTQVLVPVPDAPDDGADRGGDEEVDEPAPDLGGEYEFDDYDDVVLELTPPPVPLTATGSPGRCSPSGDGSSPSWPRSSRVSWRWPWRSTGAASDQVRTGCWRRPRASRRPGRHRRRPRPSRPSRWRPPHRTPRPLRWRAWPGAMRASGRRSRPPTCSSPCPTTGRWRAST